MVDTVGLEIELFSVRYPELLNFLKNTTKYSGKVKQYYKPYNEDIQNFRASLMQVQYESTGKSMVSLKIEYKNSYNYTIYLFYNLYKDVLSLEFSLPKFFFDTNVFQLVKHFNETNFLLNYHKDIDNLKDWYFPFFIKKLNQALSVIFGGFAIDKSHIRLKRIDYCFNLILQTKSDALSYIEMIKRVRKKYQRDSTLQMSNYQTSTYYSTKERTFKIYHKGYEFEKHDRKHLEDYNKLVGYSFYDIDRLQALADRIVRYEVEYRSLYIQRKYKEKLMFVGDPAWQKIKKGFKNFTEKFDNSCKNDYYQYKKIMFKTYQCYLKLPVLLKKSGSHIKYEYIGNNKQVMNKFEFDKKVFNLLLKEFLKFVSEYTITKLPKYSELVKLIDNYNSTHRNVIKKDAFLRFFTLYRELGKQALIDQGLYSRQAIYEWEQKIKKISNNDLDLRFFSSFDYGIEIGFEKYFENILQFPFLIKK